MARWQNGYAAACKAVYAGSIPTLASISMSFDVLGVERGKRKLPPRFRESPPTHALGGVASAHRSLRQFSRFVLLNLSWFDEPLLPELEALRKPQPVTLDGNAFPFALGFLAAEGRDPRAAGVEIIGILQARRDRGEPATIGKEEKQAILGAPLSNDGLGIRSRTTESAAFGRDEVRSARFACLGTAWIARID